MEVKINEIAVSFLLFSVIFSANAVLTKKALLSKANKKLIILALYPFKLIIYTGVIFIIHKVFGITYNTLLGIILSLVVISAFVLLTKFRYP